MTSADATASEVERSGIDPTDGCRSETFHGSWLHEEVLAGGIRLHVVRAGSGPAVLLLHGFPDFWFTWRLQIPALVEAGFLAVAPDQRGYDRSEKPPGIAAYSIEALVADIVAVVDRSCGGRACLVGHDWGGITAWYAAMRHPERFEKLAVINSPHPGSFARDLLTTRQWMHSLYMLLFQIPRLPEFLIRARDWRLLREVYRREVHNPDAFGRGELERYREAMARPGALTGALNYYRAAFRRSWRLRNADLRPIEVPTLLLWGDRDPYLLPGLAEGLEQWVPNLTVRHFPDAGHWLHLDRPDDVNRALIDFFSRG